MSLHLGKIHYWLYNKILWFSHLEEDMINLARKEGLDIEKINQEITSKYGEKVEDKPLEDIIDSSNIHGWLQGKIQLSEGRVAAWTHQIVGLDRDDIFELEKIYTNQGIKAANEVKSQGKSTDSAKDIYNLMNDYILDGMPCDNVNLVKVSEDDIVEWDVTKDVHQYIWEGAGVDVRSFYHHRSIWIKSFVSECNKAFEYVERENGLKAIKKIDRI